MADQQNPLLTALSSQGGAPPVPQTEQSLAPPAAPIDPSAGIPQRPPGTGVAEQPQAPSDRKEFFRNMLSNFLYSFAAGAANSGTGPGANVRGAGAAILAPYQREQQQKELGLQQQQVASQTAYQQAEAQRAQTQASMIQLPNGIAVPAAVYEKMMDTQLNVQGRLGVANTNAAARTGAATITTTGAAQRQGKTLEQKDKALDQQLSEFQQTQKFKTWQTNVNNDTKKQIAAIAGGKAPAGLVQTAVFANGGLTSLSDAKDAMKSLQATGTMGSLPANKVEDWIFGKGLVDPSLDANTRQAIGKLRSSLSLASSAMMRAHTGRTSQQIYEDFRGMLGPGQDWSALNGAISESERILGEYANAASDESMRKLRGGSGDATPPKNASGNRVIDLTK